MASSLKNVTSEKRLDQKLSYTTQMIIVFEDDTAPRA